MWGYYSSKRSPESHPSSVSAALVLSSLISYTPSVPAGTAKHAMPRGERKTYPESLKNWITIGNKLNHPAEHSGAVKHPVWRPRSQQSDLWFYPDIALTMAVCDKQMHNITCLSSTALLAFKLLSFTGELFPLCAFIFLQQPKIVEHNQKDKGFFCMNKCVFVRVHTSLSVQ